MGDAERGSSFYTQTLTQFLGVGAAGVENEDGLRVEDEEDQIEEDVEVLGKSIPATVKPHTPSNKRIKVNIDEVPSSQPTPFTPMLDRYTPGRSPLREKSTNVHAATPTGESTAKRPRTMVIQDSYSQGSSAVLPSSSVVSGSSPAKKGEQETISGRQPLAEIPVASLELGADSPSGAEDLTPTTRRVLGTKRMFVEIPDSDDELESVGSTPFKGTSTQQTPSRLNQEFEILKDPGSAARSEGVGVNETPASQASLGRSDKENDSSALNLGDDGESTASEAEGPGTPTPILRKTRSQTGGPSQRDRSSGSQVRTNQSQNIADGTASNAAPQTISSEESTGEEAPATPTPAPRNTGSQTHAITGESNKKAGKEVVPFEDDDLTASEDEEAVALTPILKKSSLPKPARKTTPELPTSEDPTGEEPGTPTPVVRRVQIELPSSSPGEIYKETPRKPAQKSSPIYQRHTQARSQYYSQCLESQRVPLDVIRSLGPQTDRSDILISIHPEIVDEIVQGTRDYEFRSYKFPIQVSRCWIYTTRPVGEVKYMATLGPAAEPGEVDSNTGIGNAEFNAGTSGHKFAHKLVQVYQLNNPVPLADMPDNGLGNGPPQKYRYIPPAIVGQLMANLRCPLFAEEGEEVEEEEVEEEGEEREGGGVTISQELEEQLRSDIIHSTQMLSSAVRHNHPGEDIIPASQGSPVLARRGAGVTRDVRPGATPRRSPIPEGPLPRPAPGRASQRLRNRNATGAHTSSQQQQTQPSYQRPQPQPQPQPRNPSTFTRASTRTSVRPSQATTASDVSSPDHTRSSSSVAGMGFSVPRPPPSSSEPDLPDLDMDMDGSLMRFGFGSVAGSSQSGGVLLPPDSLLVDVEGEGVGRMAPEPVVWDSEEEDGDYEEGEGEVLAGI